MYDVAHKAINIDSLKRQKPAYPITDKLAFFSSKQTPY